MREKTKLQLYFPSEYRIGQFLSNFIRYMEQEYRLDIFYLSDTQIKLYLKEYILYITKLLTK